MIYVVGDSFTTSDKYQKASWEQFVAWANEQDEFQLDLETSMSPYWSQREIVVVSLGAIAQNTQFILQYPLTEAQHNYLESVLTTKPVLAHNAAFEYVTLRFNGIELIKVYDTILVEKIVEGGVETVGYSLAEVIQRYLGVQLDKTEQTTFTRTGLTESQILYAAADVRYLSAVREAQLKRVEERQLQKVVELENRACLAFSEITYHGMTLDLKKWEQNEQEAFPLVQDAAARLAKWLTVEPFQSEAKKLGYVSDTDRICLNLNSPVQKKAMLQYVFPELSGATLPILRKFLRDTGSALSAELLTVLTDLIDRNYEPFITYLIKHFRTELVEKGYIIPAGESTLNWNSVDQVLPLLRAQFPKLKDLSDETLSKLSHPILHDLADYKDSLKLVNTYGSKFIEKFLEPDGQVRTSFNQIVSTGRVSSSKPNMQNIPAKEAVGTKYRNAFVCADDEVFVDSDFASQELALIAFVSKDPVWYAALENGQDLHSVCAELVYGDKWKRAALAECAYYYQGSKEKCKCPEHKRFRTAVKTVNFGLAYGMGPQKLSGTIGVTVDEAQNLIDQYFKVFPKIGSLLKYLGEFGVRNGYTMTLAPFNRRRYFPFWKYARHRIEHHISGQVYDGTLGEIERASKNMPEQHVMGIQNRVNSGNSTVKLRILSQAA